MLATLAFEKKKKKDAKYCPIDVYREVLIMPNYLLLFKLCNTSWVDFFRALATTNWSAKTQTPAAVFFEARDGFLHEFAVLPLNYLNWQQLK